MPQEYQSAGRTFQYPFELVIASYERRWPTCERIPVLLASTVTEEENSEDGAVTRTTRRCELAIDAPTLLRKIIGQDTAIFMQTNTLNRRERTLVIEAHNDSFQNRLSIIEGCSYKVHPDNPYWTLFEQHATLHIKSMLGMESQIEKFVIKHYLKNVERGKELAMSFLQDLFDEGVTYVPPFEAADESATDVESLAAADSFVLDDVTIKRTLGDLTELQQSALVMLHRNLLQRNITPMPETSVVFRFLKGHSFDLPKAQAALRRSMTWRGQHQVDQVLDTYQPSRLLRDYCPAAWHKSDKEGRPLLIVRPGLLDMKGLMMSGKEDLQRHVVWLNELGMRMCKERSESSGVPLRGCTCIADLEGLTFSALWQPALREMREIVDTVQTNYPEMLDRCIIVRAPRVFWVLWTILSRFVDPRTRNKIQVFTGDDYVSHLREVVDDDVLPDWLGGSDTSLQLNGGPVPEHLKDGNADSTSRTGIYNAVTVGRGSTFRLPLAVGEEESAITWDYTTHVSVAFSVYYAPRGDGETAVLSDLQVVAESTTSPDSVHGMCDCTHAGQYVLVWDNSSSWLHSRSLQYSITCVHGGDIARSMSSLSLSPSTLSRTSAQ